MMFSWRGWLKVNNKIYIFIGSKKDFEIFLDKKISKGEEICYFMELIKDYNANLRQQHAYLHGTIDVKNLVVHADDYASVYEHVIQNFITIVTTNHDVDTTFLHNPPQRVLDSLQVSFPDNIEYVYTDYKEINRDVLKEIWKRLRTDIVGQEKAKKSIVSNLFRLTNLSYNKPVVIMFLGDSGIGKTETAKAISNVLGGNLLRVQFSMMQTAEGYNYVFGAEHSKSSFAKDLMSRESNVVLIDEFDKVNPNYYNAFYQMFDEGVYIDTNYKVDLSRCIIICTSNFMSEADVIKSMGIPIFSRFDDFIHFEYLSVDEKETILDRIYTTYLENFSEEEKTLVNNSDIYEWHKDNLHRFKNVRIIKSRVEKAINDMLINNLISE